MRQKFTNKKDLLVELVRTNFKLRYNNSLLGFLWVLLKPMATFTVLYVVFSRFKGGWVENYQMYLLLGVVLYNFINDGIVYGMSSILNTAHVILKVNFPREIALASSLIMAAINFIINLFVLVIFSFFNPISPSLLSSLYFVAIIFVTFILIYAISFFTSIILVKIRDLSHITELVMQLAFYATPIFYPIESLPQAVRGIVSLNPLTILIQAARQAFIYGNIEYTNGVLVIFAISMVLLLFGGMYFKNNVKRIAENF